MIRFTTLINNPCKYASLSDTQPWSQQISHIFAHRVSSSDESVHIHSFLCIFPSLSKSKKGVVLEFWDPGSRVQSSSQWELWRCDIANNGRGFRSRGRHQWGFGRSVMWILAWSVTWSGSQLEPFLLLSKDQGSRIKQSHGKQEIDFPNKIQ